MITIVEALLKLRPNALWYLENERGYAGLLWQDENQTKPTEEEINAEIARLQAEYEAKEYQRNRASEYPSFAEQFDTLYHGGYDAWKAQIDEIKNKYPKPE